MHLAEYYMAVKALQENLDIKAIMLDRMPSIDIPNKQYGWGHLNEEARI